MFRSAAGKLYYRYLSAWDGVFEFHVDNYFDEFMMSGETIFLV